ncbi:hypothetical protein VPH35_087717 [Triticum aestivum]
MADWLSLPSELIRRISDCHLDTNELDCYMDFRAVCPAWRSATDDPKNSSELRFRPHRWIIIDEVFESHSRLLVNTVNGRIEPPHAAVVLNPFTGHMIRFKASLSHWDVGAAALSGLFTGKLTVSSLVSELSSSPSPTLILLSDRHGRQCMAVPDSYGFAKDAQSVKSFLLSWLAVGCGICAADSWQRTATLLPIALAHIDYYLAFTDILRGETNRFSLVESAGELLDNITDSDGLEHVKSIGHRAIFIGHRRCLSVPTDKFRSITPNCIYYARSSDSSLDIYHYDLGTENEDRVSEGICSLLFSRMCFTNPPCTIVQLLSSYTINARESQLAIHLGSHLWKSW